MRVGSSVAFLSLLCGLVLAGCGGGSGDGPKPLVVGMEMTYPPFEMKDAGGEPDGISVRMAEALAASLGRPLVLEDMRFEGLIPALDTGKIDLVISSMTRTEERAKSIDFSDGYVTNGLCMLVRKDAPIQGIEDLTKRRGRVAVKLATTGHTYAMQHLPEVPLIVLDTAALCVVEVVQGKVDAFIYDQVSVYKHWKEHEDTTRPILDPIRSETWGIGVRKGNEELLGQVNAFLAEYRAGGAFEELADRYMAVEKAAFEEMGVPFIFH